MTEASEEQHRRRSEQALDRLTRRAHGPRTARTWREDTEAEEARQEAEAVWKGGAR